MFKKIFEWLKNKFTRKQAYEVTPKGECLLNYICKIQSGEQYDHIQEYDDFIDEMIREDGGSRDEVLSLLKILLVLGKESAI